MHGGPPKAKTWRHKRLESRTNKNVRRGIPDDTIQKPHSRGKNEELDEGDNREDEAGDGRVEGQDGGYKSIVVLGTIRETAAGVNCIKVTGADRTCGSSIQWANKRTWVNQPYRNG